MFELRHFALPFCLHAQPDGNYRLLNRRYEPLMGEEGVVVFAKALSARQVAAISFDGSTEPTAEGFVFLYSDTCVPTASAGYWKAYSERLQRLVSWKVKT